MLTEKQEGCISMVIGLGMMLYDVLPDIRNDKELAKITESFKSKIRYGMVSIISSIVDSKNK
jgi:hypothetical protein